MKKHGGVAACETLLTYFFSYKYVNVERKETKRGTNKISGADGMSDSFLITLRCLLCYKITFNSWKVILFSCLSNCENSTLKAVRTLRPTEIHHLPCPPYLNTADIVETSASGAPSNKNPCLNNATTQPL